MEEIGVRQHAQTAETEADATRLRADAEQNRARILAAAAAAFGELGVEASMAEIARRANVGMATLFRRFPTKEALLRAVFADSIIACEADLASALADPDPWRAFQTTIEGFCEVQVRARGLAAEIITTFLDGTGFAEERQLVERQIVRLIARAQASGNLRNEVGYADFLLILKANAGVIALSGERAEEESRRLVATFLRAFRANHTPRTRAASTP
jgi:AcrR family transcriptional regulator